MLSQADRLWRGRGTLSGSMFPCPSMSVGWRMLFPSYALEVAAVAGLLILVGLRWRYERRCLAGCRPYAQTRRELEVDQLLAPIDPDKGNRALSLMLAAVAWRGDPADSQGILGLADDFFEYIEGRRTSTPRPDELSGGRIPR